MKKLTTITYLALAFFSLQVVAETTSELSFYAKLKMTGHGVNLFRQKEGDVIPSILAKSELNKVVENLEPGDETLVKGYITYKAITVEGQTKLSPLFVIESITPVSLKRLGNIQVAQDSDFSQFKMAEPNSYSPLTIPVTTELASAITITTSMLLMQNLTASGSQPHTKQQINSGLFLMSGALATGYFIYEQLSGSLKKEYK